MSSETSGEREDGWIRNPATPFMMCFGSRVLAVVALTALVVWLLALTTDLFQNLTVLSSILILSFVYITVRLIKLQTTNTQHKHS
jgi:hypothetical protein